MTAFLLPKRVVTFIHGAENADSTQQKTLNEGAHGAISLTP
jgi:hypothetical protein